MNIPAPNDAPEVPRMTKPQPKAPAIDPSWKAIAWVTFIHEIRPGIGSGTASVKALAADKLRQLYVGTFAGVHVVFLIDASLKSPGIFPMTNVASFGT